MGQNNLESIQQRPHLQNWVPHDSQLNIFVNRATHQQVQRHSLKIASKDISKETALLTARMNCYQIYICRLFYFHPAATQSRGGQYSDREMLLYTDKMQPVKDWSRQRIKYMIIGLKRLVASYGPFRISENNIKENQRRQIRVWISQNPAKSHPDLAYKNEESIVSDLTVLLSRKNQEVSSLIIGSRTLKQAFQRFQQGNRQTESPLLGNSKKSKKIQDDFILKPNQNNKIQKTSYRNGYAFTDLIKDKNEHSRTPNNRKLSSFPNSAMANNSKQLQPKLGNSNSSKYSDPNSNFLNVPINSPNNNRYSYSRCKDVLESGIEYKRSYKQENAKNKINQVKTETIYNSSKKQQLYKNTESSFISSSVKADAKFIFHHRFQTMQNLTHSKHYEQGSSKAAKIIYAWNDQSSTSACENKQQGLHANNTRGDITIINNNVNNYVTNIIHNHIAPTDKKTKDNTQSYKIPPRPKHKESNNNQNNNKQKDKNRNIPFFIQQKTKGNNHQTAQSPSKNNTKSISDNSVKRKPKDYASSQETSQQFNDFKQSEKQTTKFISKESQTKNQLQNDFPQPKDHHLSPPKYGVNLENLYYKKNNDGSLTPNSQNTSYQKNNDNLFEVKNTGRTKTAQYYQKGQICRSRDSSPNRGITHIQVEQRGTPSRKQTSKSIYEIKQSPIIMEDSAQYVIPSPQHHKNKKPNQEPHSQAKQDFKKQLKQEFKFLLGNDAPQQKQEQKNILQFIPVAEAVQVPKQTNECRQGEVDVRQKIKKKQMVFAELKKQALKVLTGD